MTFEPCYLHYRQLIQTLEANISPVSLSLSSPCRICLVLLTCLFFVQLFLPVVQVMWLILVHDSNGLVNLLKWTFTLRCSNNNQNFILPQRPERHKGTNHRSSCQRGHKYDLNKSWYRPGHQVQPHKIEQKLSF